MPKTNSDISALVRENVRNLTPYSSARDEYSGSASVYLDANENPFNSPYNRYPDPHQRELKTLIGGIKKVSEDELFIGNGSDEAIDMLFRVFCTPGEDNIVAISPSYGMYQVCADINDVEVRNVNLNSDFSLNIEALLKASDAHTKLFFLCSPNNPSGNSFPIEQMLDIAEKSNAIVVVDEAYIDFSSQKSLSTSISAYKNLVILQTFSKAWGLAGIRLGIAMADPAIINYMSRVKYPYNINKLTMDFALNALSKEAEKNTWVEEILSQRKRVERKLKVYRFVKKVYPSDANFLLVEVMNPKELYAYLVGKEIIVRDRSNVALCAGCLRITIGSEEENSALLDELMNYQRDYVDACQI